MDPPRPPGDPPAVARPTGETTEEEGEIPQPGRKRPFISIKASASASASGSTSGPSTAASAGRREPLKLSMSLPGAIKSALGVKRTANPLKSLPASSNKSLAATSPPAGTTTLSILGQARARELSSNGEGAAADASSATNGTDSGPAKPSNPLATSTARGATSSPAVAVTHLDGQADETSRTTPPPFIRKRSSTKSPRKTRVLSSGSFPTAEPTEEDRHALELLKAEHVVPTPASSLAPPLDAVMAPRLSPATSTSSLALPPRPLDPLATNQRSHSPPRRKSPVPAPRPTLHMDRISDYGAGLPYNDDNGDDSREEGEESEPTRTRVDATKGKWQNDRYQDDYRSYEDRSRIERRREEERREYDRPYRPNHEAERRGRYEHRPRSPPYPRPRDQRLDWDRSPPGRASYDDYDRPPKRHKRSPTPDRAEPERRVRNRPRSRSRSRSSDYETSRSVSRSPGVKQASLLSPATKRRKELELKEESERMKRGEGPHGKNRSDSDRGQHPARQASPPSNGSLRLNLALPPRPNVPVGGSLPAQSRRHHDRSFLPGPPPGSVGPNRHLSQGAVGGHSHNSTAESGAFRSRMMPSTIADNDSRFPSGQPTPPSRTHALPQPVPLNGNANDPPRPFYGSIAPRHPPAVSAFEPQSSVPAPRLPHQPPPPPPLPTNSNGEYPNPPPAPYHAGNAPTDPASTALPQNRATPVEPSAAQVASNDAPFLGVRSLNTSGSDPWVEPSPPSADALDTDEAAAGIETPKEEEEEREHRFFGASHISEYTLQQKLGEGTFGVVYKGVRGKEAAVVTEREREEETEMWKRGLRVRKGDVVALKQIIFHNEGDGLPITSVREIRILKQLDHPNVVPVVDMAFDPGDPAKFEVGRTFMVFPYMDHDLAGLLENPQVKLDLGEIKQYGRQLLEGTAYLHRNGILHRDMKAANLLINNKGVLMIADFGLARSMESPSVVKDYTSCVVTRWYRPPELLLGERKYHYPVDMWGVGCILLEMFKRSPIFPGNSDFHQAQLIFAMCGPPTEESMPGWHLLPGVEGIDKSQQQWKNGPRNIRADAARWDNEVFADLLDKILVLDPKRRLTAAEALDHDWFWIEPFPTEPSRMREFMSSHEYDRRKIKENQQAAFGQVLPPQPMIQPRPQPMAPMGYNHAPPLGMSYQPPVGAYNAPPPPFNPSGMGMQPSFALPPGAGGGGHFAAPPGYGPPTMNGYAGNRPPPSIVHQQQPHLHPSQFGGPPVGLDYGGGSRQYHPQSSQPSWLAASSNRSAAPDGGPKKVNLMARLKPRD